VPAPEINQEQTHWQPELSFAATSGFLVGLGEAGVELPPAARDCGDAAPELPPPPPVAAGAGDFDAGGAVRGEETDASWLSRPFCLRAEEDGRGGLSDRPVPPPSPATGALARFTRDSPICAKRDFSTGYLSCTASKSLLSSWNNSTASAGRLPRGP
jgi:hypothetical protein